LAPCLSWLAVILAGLGASGCKQLEEVVDTSPNYYYCLRATYPGFLGINLLPGEVATIRLTDGPCLLTWDKAEHLPISGAMPFVVRAVSLDDGIHISPLGVTSSNEIRVSVDASLAEKPWMLSNHDGQSAHLTVTLQNPRRASRGYETSLYVWVKNPFESNDPVKRSDVSLRSNYSWGVTLGNAKVSTEISRPVLIFNEGSKAATLANVAVANCSPSPCPFVIGGLAPGSTINEGSSGVLTAVFKPTQVGPAHADIFVNPTEGRPVKVPLYGTGQ